MRRILVTGANKGIGRAIARAILAEHADTFVLLGSRDEGRGREAAAALTGENASWGARLAVVPIDVADERSVASARARVQDLLGAEQLYGLVNNAGLGGESSLAEILAVNALGVRRVTEAFLPMLERGVGRVVNVTSASGPTFVAGCSPEMQRFFRRDDDLAAPRGVHRRAPAMGSDKAAFAARGLGDGNAYGLQGVRQRVYAHQARA
ncbi:MAG: SDR family NAD(P)-dependent oxidoreductase [Polyangiaceae bacterium]